MVVALPLTRIFTEMATQSAVETMFMVTLFIISKRQEETEMKGQKTNEKRDTEEDD